MPQATDNQRAEASVWKTVSQVLSASGNSGGALSLAQMIAVGDSLASVISLNSSTNRLGPLRSVARTVNASTKMPNRTSAFRVRGDIGSNKTPSPCPLPKGEGFWECL